MPRHSRPHVWTFVLVFAILVLAVSRVLAVQRGVLFGTGPILFVDIFIGAAVVLSLWLRHRLTTSPSQRERSASIGWPELLGVFAAVLGAPALVASTLNLVAPATPPDLPAAACAGAQTWDAAYQGKTVGPEGNYARSGPGLSFPQTDRFESNCVLGFEGYCIGDPITDPLVTTWTDTRWLLVERHRSQPGRLIAGRLSGEPDAPRFVAMAYVAPVSPDEDLRYLGDGEGACNLAGMYGRARPGTPSITASPIREDGSIPLDVAVDGAERVGVALAVATPDLRAGGPVRWVGSGVPDADGRYRAVWRSTATVGSLARDRSAPVTATLVATACLGPLGPSAPDRSATLSYTIDPNGEVTTAPDVVPLDEELMDRSLRMACDTEADEAALLYAD